MSHFSKLKVKLKDVALVRQCAEKRGWTVTQEEEFTNRWSRETIKNGHVVRAADGRVKLVISPDGDVMHDSYFMGHEAPEFLCQYSEAFIRRAAARDGGTVHFCGSDNQGNIVLEVAYAM
jgi:hypothetical protein